MELFTDSKVSQDLDTHKIGQRTEGLLVPST